jgi:hypothetical protein
MTRSAKHRKFWHPTHGALLGAALLTLGFSAMAGGALADDKGQTPAAAQPSPSQPSPSQPATAAPATPAPPSVSPQAAPAFKPGFLQQLKVWWDDSVAVFDSKHGKDGEPNKKPDDATPGARQPAVADAAKEAPKEVPKEASKEAPRDALKDARKDTLKDVTKNPAKEAPKELPKDASKGTPKDATKNAASEPPKDVPNDAPQDASKNPLTVTTDAMKSAVEATKGAAAATTDAMKNAMEATKNAAAAIVRLPNTRVVEVHEACALAPNGAPDCALAAATGCRGKGFTNGKPLDVRTAEKCQPKPFQPGQMPGMQCAREAVVTRAVCQ